MKKCFGGAAELPKVSSRRVNYHAMIAMIMLSSHATINISICSIKLFKLVLTIKNSQTQSGFNKDIINH